MPPGDVILSQRNFATRCMASRISCWPAIYETHHALCQILSSWVQLRSLLCRSKAASMLEYPLTLGSAAISTSENSCLEKKRSGRFCVKKQANSKLYLLSRRPRMPALCVKSGNKHLRRPCRTRKVFLRVAQQQPFSRPDFDQLLYTVSYPNLRFHGPCRNDRDSQHFHKIFKLRRRQYT